MGAAAARRRAAARPRGAVPGRRRSRGTGRRRYATTSVTVAVWTRAPLIALIVSVYEPEAADGSAAIARAPSPGAVRTAGTKDAVTPAGTPLTDSATGPVKVPAGASVTRNAVAPPRATVRIVGIGRTVKSGVPTETPGGAGGPVPDGVTGTDTLVPVTDTANVAVRLSPPLVPVIVTM